MGVGIGVGSNVGTGVGGGVGVGVGLGVGTGVGFGEGTGVGTGDGIGVGCGYRHKRVTSMEQGALNRAQKNLPQVKARGTGLKWVSELEQGLESLLVLELVSDLALGLVSASVWVLGH
jgi:hypothetical protein